jgi:hypothetical protein
MKMWVSVTSSTDVSAVIRTVDLQIESYTEQLVTMFNAIVSRDAQSPHGKFYFVAKRLQERFAQIKEGAASKDEQGESDYEAGQQSPEAQRRPTPRQPSVAANQTPLHLLSEVAMGTSSSSLSPQQQAHSRSQQQAQAALQATTQQVQQQPMQQQQNWFPGMPVQPLDQLGLAQANFDINFDFTMFDLGTGSDADLSALFIPDAAMWNYGVVDPNIQAYSGF